MLTVTDAGSLRFDFRAGQIGHNVANAAMFLWNCVAQALRRAYGSATRCKLRRNIASRGDRGDMLQFLARRSLLPLYCAYELTFFVIPKEVVGNGTFLSPYFSGLKDELTKGLL